MVEHPQDCDDARGKDRPGEDAVQRTTVELDAIDPDEEGREDVDIRRVCAEQTRGHGETRATLQPHVADERTSERMGYIVQLRRGGQSLCGSFSTCQVWPLLTSFWRSKRSRTSSDPRGVIGQYNPYARWCAHR